MLDFSRASSGQKKLCNINNVITEIRDSVKDQLASKNIKLDLSLSPDIPDRHLSEDGMYKCLMNLIINASEAIKHSNGVIQVTTAHGENETIVIKIKDNGEGIPPDVMSRLFTPFYTTKGSIGTGLGLCTTMKIVEENNGKISVESTLGEGTTFTIVLFSEETKISEP
jgi:signal transduction histidine kinase